MARKRYTEEQIIAVLNEAEAGAKTGELCRKHGMSEATFYKWKAKYASFGGFGLNLNLSVRVFDTVQFGRPGLIILGALICERPYRPHQT